MQIPDTLFSDPRFLEVVRFLLKDRQALETALPDEETPDDEATRRVRVKILLRLKKRKSNRKRI